MNNKTNESSLVLSYDDDDRTPSLSSFYCSMAERYIVVQWSCYLFLCSFACSYWWPPTSHRLLLLHIPHSLCLSPVYCLFSTYLYNCTHSLPHAARPLAIQGFQFRFCSICTTSSPSSEDPLVSRPVRECVCVFVSLCVCLVYYHIYRVTFL